MSQKFSNFTYATAKKCPICGMDFEFEKILSKKIAASRRDLSLRNIYEPPDPARPEPLLFSLVVCPGCLYTAYEPEFEKSDVSAEEIRAARKASLKILAAAGLSSADMTSSRSLSAGIASYRLAEVWYEMRRSLPARRFRLALSLLRRHWLNEKAVADGLAPRENFLNESRDLLGHAEELFEEAYLRDRLPDSLFFGPDFGANLGIESIPHLVAWCNFTLAGNLGIPSTERPARLSKARKFIDISLRASSARRNLEVRRKTEELKELVQAAQEAVEGALKATAENGFAPELETQEWALKFEKLYEKHGREYQPGEVILKEGEQSFEMFFLLEGEADVLKEYDTHPRLLARLGKGSFFGELSLLDSAPRFASVVAVERCRLIRVARADLKAIIGSWPELALRMMAILAKRTRNYESFVKANILPLVSRERAADGGEARPNQTLIIELEGLLREIVA